MIKKRFRTLFYIGESSQMFDSIDSISYEEEKILKYTKTHEAITKNDVIGLLEVSASTAVRVIRRMVQKNLLQRKGKARNIHYTIVE